MSRHLDSEDLKDVLWPNMWNAVLANPDGIGHGCGVVYRNEAKACRRISAAVREKSAQTAAKKLAISVAKNGEPKRRDSWTGCWLGPHGTLPAAKPAPQQRSAFEKFQTEMTEKAQKLWPAPLLMNQIDIQAMHGHAQKKNSPSSIMDVGQNLVELMLHCDTSPAPKLEPLPVGMVRRGSKIVDPHRPKTGTAEGWRLEELKRRGFACLPGVR